MPRNYIYARIALNVKDTASLLRPLVQKQFKVRSLLCIVTLLARVAVHSEKTALKHDFWFRQRFVTISRNLYFRALTTTFRAVQHTVYWPFVQKRHAPAQFPSIRTRPEAYWGVCQRPIE